MKANTKKRIKYLSTLLEHYKLMEIEVYYNNKFKADKNVLN